MTRHYEPWWERRDKWRSRQQSNWNNTWNRAWVNNQHYNKKRKRRRWSNRALGWSGNHMVGLYKGFNDSKKSKDWSHFAKSIWDFYDAGIGNLPGFTMSPTQMFPGAMGREFFGKAANMTVDGTKMAMQGAGMAANGISWAAMALFTAVVTGLTGKAKKVLAKDNPEKAE